MNIFDLLADLAPGLSQARGVSRPQRIETAGGWDSPSTGSVLGRGVRRGLPLLAEDDQIVDTNQGRMPLWAVEGGIQRIPEPRVQPQQFPVPGSTRGINGAVNPLWQMQKGHTPSGLGGEGPRTNFNRYR